jgi:hypothetical protein
MHTQNYTKNYKIVLTLPDDEPVKRASTGSRRTPVVSGTGADAWAGARCVRAAPVASGWSQKRPQARARAAGRRGRAGGR